MHMEEVVPWIWKTDWTALYEHSSQSGLDERDRQLLERVNAFVMSDLCDDAVVEEVLRCFYVDLDLSAALDTLVTVQNEIVGGDYCDEEEDVLSMVESLNKEIQDQVYGYFSEAEKLGLLRRGVDDILVGSSINVDQFLKGDGYEVTRLQQAVFNGAMVDMNALNQLFSNTKSYTNYFPFLNMGFFNLDHSNSFDSMVPQPNHPQDILSVTKPQDMKIEPDDYIVSYPDSLVVVQHNSIKKLRNIAAFDMDSTLIVTKSGRTFPTSKEDWKFINTEVVHKLKETYKTHDIVILTNQLGISKGRTDPNDIIHKIISISENLNIPIIAIMATKNDIYRKPNTGMWDYLMKVSGFGNTSQCYFVGDAAGRINNTRTNKKDFSCDDRKFAENVGISFLTENEYYNEIKNEPFEWGSINPRDFCFTVPNTIRTKPQQEMVLLIGPPASGKSTISKQFISAGYQHVNRDTLKTKDKCIFAARNALDDGYSVIVDNTNPDMTSRNSFIKIAKDFSIPVRCVVMRTDLELAKHLNVVRERMGITKRVPEIAYQMYKKKFEEPSLEEGYVSIEDAQFSPEFTSDLHKKYFLQWS